MSKLFGNEINESLENLEVLSVEDLVVGSLEANNAYNEFLTVLNGVNAAKEACAVLQTNIAISKEALESDSVSVNDVKFLNSSINATMQAVGLNKDPFSISNEDITDPKEALTLSIEEGNGLIMKVINTVTKTFARFNNILGKYLGKFDTLLINIFINLEKVKKEIQRLEVDGKTIKVKKLADDSLLMGKALTMLGVMGINADNAPAKGIKEILAIYKDPKYISKFVDLIVSMGKTDGPLKPIYNNPDVMRRLERNFGKKIKNFFCKSTPDDRVILGANYNNVFILERCKPLHIDIKLNPYIYTVLVDHYQPMDATGNSISFEAPTFKEMYEVLDMAMEVAKNHKKYTDKIHDIIKVNGEHIDKLEEASDWENQGIISIIPMVLLVLSKTYADIPSAADSLGKLFIKELKA